jgi:YidC/Oxa1 family membrane protein insertase
MKSSRKIFFIIYIIFLVSLTINLFTKKEPIPPPPVRIVTDFPKNVLPKIPTIFLANDTASLSVNGITQPNSLQGFCRIVEVPSMTKTPLIGHTREDILTLQETFSAAHETLNLRFTYTSPDKVISEVTTTVDKAGYFRLFFRTFFYDPVYNLFAALILIFPGYSLGFAIVTITILIRLILLAPQQHMLVSQRRMQELQPRLKAIQETHKGDQAAIGMKTMELYKKEGVNPFGSLLPIFIQIPILIVLYQVVLNISLPVNLAHLYDMSWIQNFKNIMPDPNFYGIHLEKSGGIVGIVLGVST